MNGTQAMAQRIVNANSQFAETLMGIAGCTREEAFRAIETLKKAKAIKVDPVMGQMIVKHGAFMEADVIRRAIAV